MQLLPIYLYSNVIDAIIDLDFTVQGENRVMYQHDLKIQKGIKNKVRIQFKNSDQKLLSITSTQTFVFNMFDPYSQTLVLQKELNILDDTFSLIPGASQSSPSNTLLFSDTSNLHQGLSVTGYGIPANTTVISVSTNTVTLNNSTVQPISSSTSLTFNTLALRGIGELVINESDTIDLSSTSYNYSITTLDTDGTYLPTYVNTYYGISGNIYLSEEVYPKLKPSQEITILLKSYNQQTQLYEHKSGNIYAYPEFNGNTALHTLAMYMTNFIGTVYIQGTLSNQPDNYGKYTTIQTLNYNGFSGVDYFNFNGVFTYIRIMFVPAANPAGLNNDDPTYYGSFDKALYRS